MIEISINCNLINQNRILSAPDDLHAEYDFIVVGSGPGGCVVANRLSENPSVTVLLLEAGPRPTTIHTVPLYGQYADQPGFNWNYRLNPYPGSCLALKGQQCAYPLGKMLGGSSSLNYQIYARGNPADYDRWQSLGNNGWSYADLVPLFKRLENTTLVHNVDRIYRGVSGPLSVTHSEYRTELAKAFVEASGERGMPFMDYNGASQIAVDYTQATTSAGRRASAANAYLDPVKNRQNLHVMINSLVSKVIIDEETKTATGVEYIHRGESHRVLARREVILSAGPINSPQLLMLSGVGPKGDLERLNISVLADLPVGQNYEDHVSLPGIVYRVNDNEENINMRDISDEDVDRFVKRGTGKLSVPSALEGISFYHLGISNVSRTTPEIEFLFSGGRNELGYSGFTTYRDEVYEAAFKPTEDPSVRVFSYFMLDLYPEARGRISLRGNSIHNPPIIEFTFLHSKRDMEVFLRGIRETLELAKTEAFQRKGAKINEMPLPDCARHGFGSDAYWRCYVRHMVRNNCHISGSARMGVKGNPQAVVDPELRVHGIGKLRVADSSIAPTQIAGHSQAVAYLIGEKMAEVLKRQWNL